MNEPFANTYAPEYLTSWALRNLEITDDNQLLAETIDKNIKAYADHEQADEIKRLLVNFKHDLNTHTRYEMVSHYKRLAKEPVPA